MKFVFFDGCCEQLDPFIRFKRICNDITNAQINCTYGNATKEDKALVKFAEKNTLAENLEKS